MTPPSPPPGLAVREAPLRTRRNTFAMGRSTQHGLILSTDPPHTTHGAAAQTTLAGEILTISGAPITPSTSYRPGELLKQSAAASGMGNVSPTAMSPGTATIALEPPQTAASQRDLGEKPDMRAGQRICTRGALPRLLGSFDGPPGTWNAPSPKPKALPCLRTSRPGQQQPRQQQQHQQTVSGAAIQIALAPSPASAGRACVLATNPTLQSKVACRKVVR